MSTDLQEGKEEGQKPKAVDHSEATADRGQSADNKENPSSVTLHEAYLAEPAIDERISVLKDNSKDSKVLKKIKATLSSVSSEDGVTSSQGCQVLRPKDSSDAGLVQRCEETAPKGVTKLTATTSSSIGNNQDFVSVSKSPTITTTTTSSATTTNTIVTTKATLTTTSSHPVASITTDAFSSCLRSLTSTSLPLSPPSRSVTSQGSSNSPVVAEMGLQHPLGGVNGHAIPRGVRENREVPCNPRAPLAAPSPSTARHRERLIAQVVGSVAPPPLRTAEAQRERLRLNSAARKLMSKPVKRKLWEVDHEKLESEIEGEYKQMIEEEEKRFRERWEELGAEVIPDAPKFYHSEVISTTGKSSSTSTQKQENDLRQRTSVAAPAATSASSDVASAVSHRASGSSDTPTVLSDTSPIASESQNSNGEGESVSKDVASSSPLLLSSDQKKTKGDLEVSPPRETSRPLDVSCSSSSSGISSLSPPSLNSSTTCSRLSLSTASFYSSSSGVSSLESTPAETNTPSTSGTSTGILTTPVGRRVTTTPTPDQHTPHPQSPLPPPTAQTVSRRPRTRSSQNIRSSRRSTKSPPRKQLRM